MRHNLHVVESPQQIAAQSTLLETKLYAPQWRSGMVPRARLLERLEQVTVRKLTLISAPAGFGKSTLLAEWLASSPDRERYSAWVSLDQSDNDPALFWAYFITALQKVQPGVDESILASLQSHNAPPIESLLASLLNEISANSRDSSTNSAREIVLVLDDYHSIDADAIHAGVVFLLDHLPPNMHLVITGRADPPLPLARLRGRGELIEIRATDLRFTPEEAADFLKDVMGLDLSIDHVAALEMRTEGWIAGLQLAALSMQGRDDVPGFIEAFAGDDRYVLDYLVEEVLHRQPKRIRNFLLQTSILDRLTGPLCDAVTGQNDSKAMLEKLERSNLFLVPLDGNRQWYRYHHLFREVLRSRLGEEQSDQLHELHRNAGDWYENNSQPAQVVRHALAGEDFARAAAVMEMEALEMMGRCEEPTLLEWFNILPEEIIRVRPVLSMYYGFILLTHISPDEAEPWTIYAERWIDNPPDRPGLNDAVGSTASEMVVTDEKAYRSLPGSIALTRAYRAGLVGDVETTLVYARQALENLPEDDNFWRGVATAFLGISYWTTGELEAAYETFAEGVATLKLNGDTDIEVSGEVVLASIRMSQGRLREAKRILESSIEIAENHSKSTLFGAADLQVGLGKLYREWGDLAAAKQHLQTGEDMDEAAAISENKHHAYILKSQFELQEGNYDAALDLLTEADRLYTPTSTPTPDLRPAAAHRAKVWIAQGRLTEASDWARNRGLSAKDELSFAHEYEHITLAALSVAKHRSDPAEHSIQGIIELLERLLDTADAAGRVGSIIEILVALSLAHEAKGDISAGLVSLKRALELAEPEGYLRVFVDEGEPMRNLLRHAASAGIASDYTNRLLAAFESSPSGSTNAPVDQSGLVEPLSDREIEILRLIAAGMTNQEIAAQLVVSISTIKTHINRTYRKLDVHSRTQALVKISELGIA
jgi:LuxR family transcriptional regulator, maltose regulon positive regulatory protein